MDHKMNLSKDASCAFCGEPIYMVCRKKDWAYKTWVNSNLKWFCTYNHLMEFKRTKKLYKKAKK